VKTTAALLITIGLAFAGFGSAGFAARADTGAATTTTEAASPCTRDHPCADPGCSVSGYSPGDCFTQTTETATTPTTETTTATTETTTTATTETTTTNPPPSPCTSAHPCPNPGCEEAGFGPGDCFTPTTATQQTTPTPTTDTTPTTTTVTTTTATTDTTPTTGSTQVDATQTGTTATSPGVSPPVAAATTTAATTPIAPATTTTSTAPFLPPAAPTKPKPPGKTAPFVPPATKVQAATSTNPSVTLPFTGATLSPYLLVAFGLIGLGLVAWWLGRENA